MKTNNHNIYQSIGGRGRSWPSVVMRSIGLIVESAIAYRCIMRFGLAKQNSVSHSLSNRNGVMQVLPLVIKEDIPVLPLRTHVAESYR